IRQDERLSRQAAAGRQALEKLLRMRPLARNAKVDDDRGGWLIHAEQSPTFHRFGNSTTPYGNKHLKRLSHPLSPPPKVSPRPAAASSSFPAGTRHSMVPAATSAGPALSIAGG